MPSANWHEGKREKQNIQHRLNKILIIDRNSYSDRHHRQTTSKFRRPHSLRFTSRTCLTIPFQRQTFGISPPSERSLSGRRRFKYKIRVSLSTLRGAVIAARSRGGSRILRLVAVSSACWGCWSWS